MIDLHCHLLPGIDDGAARISDSMTLARMAVNNGITHAVLTPHIQLGRYNNNRQRIEQAFARFWQMLGEQEIPLGVSIGAEVRIDPMILPMVERDEIPFLGELEGQPVMLLEFPHDQILPGSDKLVAHLLARNIRPMIAHPERNRAVIGQLERIRPFVEMGCLLQLTAASLAGRFTPQIARCARQLLERGWVEVIATDAHNSTYRPPDLAQGYTAAAAIVGEEAARALVLDHPLAIVASGME